MFHFFDHTGDIGIDIEAPDLSSVFADAACAFTETITAGAALPGTEASDMQLAADALDLLLVDWLSELLYRFETTAWLPRHVDAAVSRTADGWGLQARLTGGTVDPERHEIRVLVKAVTYHALLLEQTEAGWRARVILDI